MSTFNLKDKLLGGKVYFKSAMKLGNRPDFLIIGAQKAGTTSLFNYIKKFSSNFVPPVHKELQYFSELYKTKNINFYEAFFPSMTNRDQITGEATPDYLFYHKSPEKIVEFLPKTKIIILLRDPVKRAYSAYNFQKFTNRTSAYNPLSFEDAVKNDIDRHNKDEYLKKNDFDYIYKYFSYVSRGLYYEQINRWFNFFPREQFLIIKSEKMFSETEETLKKVFSFLNLRFKKDIKYNFKKYNSNEYEKIKSDTEDFLYNFYKPYNEKLSELLNKDFDWVK